MPTAVRARSFNNKGLVKEYRKPKLADRLADLDAVLILAEALRA